jgi:DNA repair exonuclease SbcCD ATPase subunit
MILHSIKLTYVGRFRSTVQLGPFAPGLNVLSAPNESGKSTSLHAAARALFDRHTTKSEELKALQPAGTDLAPSIAIDFETRAGRFLIEKTFLNSPRSTLSQWQSNAWHLVADADQADQRVQALLQSSLPGRGATKPANWGFLGFLWARQGEPAAWPGLDDEAVGQRIRARLARVELDPVIEQLRARLSASADSILTSSGKSKAGGPLATAEDDLAAIEAQLADLRQTRANLDVTHQRYHQADASVAQLEKELTERTALANQLREQTLAAERLRGELDARRQALTTAQEKLTALAADSDQLTSRRGSLATTQKELGKAEAAALAAEQSLTQTRTRLDDAQAELPKHENHLNALRAKHQRLQSLLKLREYVTTAATLSKQVTKAEAATAEIAALEARRAKLPTLTTAKLSKLEALAGSVHTLRTQLQALGLTVELTPENKTSAEIQGEAAAHSETLLAGKTTRLHRPQSLDLHLTGWGRILIRSGAQDAQNAAAELATAEADLRDALQADEIASVEAAREAVATGKELDSQIKIATAALKPHLGEHDSLAELREVAATATRRADALTATLSPTVTEKALSLTDLETAEASHGEALPAAEKALKTLNKQIDQLRTEERTSVQSVQGSNKLVGEHRARLGTLESQVTDLSARYPDGIESAKTAAQLAFAQAEARVVATTAELPADFEKLPERNKRAAAALQQLTDALKAGRTERDQARGILETLGGQGLYSRETELEEKKTEALLRRDAARTQGWCTRIAHDLIEHRKQAATKAVLTPLESRLTSAFAELTGVSDRKVFLDENLQIAGIGRTRDSVHAFDNLSQGAKEQLLLCLRLAVAQELAADEPQVLILDDVLVNTDSVRQERILDVLSAQSARLQIIILTCHQDRYRGIGQTITFSGQQPNNS